MGDDREFESSFDLSICIVAFNFREITLECLRSLIAQTQGIKYELFLFDNGSTDGIGEAVQKEFSKVKLIRKDENGKWGAANNQVLRLAQGRYCILLNNDTIFESDALSQMVEFMDERGDVGVLGCRMRYPDRRIQLIAHGDIRWQDHLFHALFLNKFFPRSRVFGHIDCTYLDLEADGLIADVDWVAGAALMVRKNFMDEVGFLDENIVGTGEDWEWCRRFASKGYRVVYNTDAEIIHYHGISTIRYNGPEEDGIRERTLMRQTAACHYVYRKLHVNEPIRTFLFSLCYRMHWLTRGFVHGFLYFIGVKSKGHGLGATRGFFKGALMRYEILAQRFLDIR